jgi:hypothetical protein
MMVHGYGIANLIEVERPIHGGRAVSFLVIEIIEDGKEVGCSGIARTEAGKCPQSPSPGALKFTEFIADHSN